MDTQELKYIYLLGAGGIGMSALGRYFLNSGKTVAGYDKTPSPLTDELISEGMHIGFTDTPDALPEFIKSGPSSDKLVIYTPAIPADSEQLRFIQNAGFRLQKRAAVLGMIAASHKTIAIAGTHGKTTTSTMVAHLLTYAGLNPVAFLGGISVNYTSNFLPGKPNSILVAEADEFDRSFLTLKPDTGVITSVDADHLDIYGEASALMQSFSDFADTVKRKLIVKAGLELPNRIVDKAFTYHTKQSCSLELSNYTIEGDQYTFSVQAGDLKIEDIALGIPGLHNVENAMAAIAVGLDLGLPAATIRGALESFKGVKRRFEYIVRSKEFVYIDDYAHHPTELSAFISSVRAMYPDKRITGVFQPHLFSRTRDFMDDFASSLSMLDEVYLMEIYPAREKPIPGISSLELLHRIAVENKQLVDTEELFKRLQQNRPEVLLTMGAGDIDRIVLPLRDTLQKKNQVHESQN